MTEGFGMTLSIHCGICLVRLYYRREGCLVKLY